jgi:hypothetical protein
MVNINKEGGVVLTNGKKPLRLLKDILRFACPLEGTVLDFFAGSGTTGHAVLDLNASEPGSRRRFILVTNNEPETDDKGQPTGRLICHDICYPRFSGNFIVGERGSYEAVGKERARPAAAKGAEGLDQGGALRQLGGSLRFFVADHAAISREEARVRDRAAIRVADLAADTLRLVSDCYQRVETGTNEFDIFESDARVLAILHRYAARARLVAALRGMVGEREIHIFPSLPGGHADERWFVGQLGKRVTVRPLPDPIIQNYNNLIREARR